MFSFRHFVPEADEAHLRHLEERLRAAAVGPEMATLTLDVIHPGWVVLSSTRADGNSAIRTFRLDLVLSAARQADLDREIDRFLAGWPCPLE